MTTTTSSGASTTTGLSRLIYHRNPVVRTMAVAAIRHTREPIQSSHGVKPALANSVPKSGTHLLEEVMRRITGLTNYGIFVNSMTNSYRFRERPSIKLQQQIMRLRDGELARAHLHFSPDHDERLVERGVFHALIIRDPRAVAVSEAHFLRDRQKHHRLHRHFRGCGDLDEAVMLALDGIPGVDSYPDIEARFAEYEPWMTSRSCMVVRFEDLVDPVAGPRTISRLADGFVADRPEPMPVDSEEVWKQVIGPGNAEHYTFREGSAEGWRTTFERPRLRERTEQLAPLLKRLGYPI